MTETTKIQAARQEYADWCSAIGIDSLEKLDEVLAGGGAVDFKSGDVIRDLLQAPPTRFTGFATGPG